MGQNLAAEVSNGATKNHAPHTAVSPLSRTFSPLVFFTVLTLQRMFVQCFGATVPIGTRRSALPRKPAPEYSHRQTAPVY
ncbi:hypothetical protein [Paraburkholderia hiiakae]|uniref:hypothetical protein n=1 Tax=Paraburkholderia hiiakae TaxID=1081782 RepID=UPI001919B393|nr:hypothetical protein [Paraburkholderia hiiakae]